MRRLLWCFLLLVLSGAAPVYPTCNTIGKVNPCVTTADLMGDVVVNIRFFGAKGDGTTDDTVAIQTAIDYAANNGLQTIFCPTGNYKISGAGNAMLYLDPPGNLRSNFANPGNSSFSLGFVGEAHGIGTDVNQGCQLLPTTNSTIALITGPGHDMLVDGIAVVGPGGTYRGNQNTAGVGIGIAGGGGGAHHTLIRNTHVGNFYQAYATDANGGCCLADSNNFEHITADNAFIGIAFTGTQSFINQIIEPTFSNVTINIDDRYSHQVNVFGGNLSPFSSQGGSFGVSGTSGLTQVASSGGFTFTTTVASPDIYWPNVYNAFTMLTGHFGLVPMTLDAFNSGTNVATFHIRPQWTNSNFATIDLSSAGNSNLATEIKAVTTVFAAERVTTVRGQGASLEGVHIENPNACQTLYDLQQVFGGAKRATLKNLFFDSDPGLANYVPANSPTQQQLAWFYCQQTFGFIDGDTTGGQGRLEIDGGDFQQTSVSPSLMFNLQPGFPLSVRQASGLAQLNESVWDVNWFSYSGLSAIWQTDTVFHGAGDFDTFYFLPKSLPGGLPCTVPPFFEPGAVRCLMTQGGLSVPYHGYHPAPGVTPNLTQNLLSKVTGVLGVLASYPPIDCETAYKAISYTGTDKFLYRSASCPGYSWGQTLTDTPVGETIKWLYTGQSNAVYFTSSPKTLSWMFPGLAFTLTSSADKLVVTGVYPELGYITAVDATTASGSNPYGTPGGSPLPGAVGQQFSCNSACTIGQAAYSWTSTAN